jgi:hypothetical protein
MFCKNCGNKFDECSIQQKEKICQLPCDIYEYRAPQCHDNCKKKKKVDSCTLCLAFFILLAIILLAIISLFIIKLIAK